MMPYLRSSEIFTPAARLAKSGSPPETPSTGDQTEDQYHAKSSDPLEVHCQRRYDSANAKSDEDSCCGEHDRVVPPTPLFFSPAKLVACLRHNGSVVVQSVSVALAKYSLVCGAM